MVFLVLYQRNRDTLSGISILRIDLKRLVKDFYCLVVGAATFLLLMQVIGLTLHFTSNTEVPVTITTEVKVRADTADMNRLYGFVIAIVAPEYRRLPLGTYGMIPRCGIGSYVTYHL